MRQTRSCNPSGCDDTSCCVNRDSCTSAPVKVSCDFPVYCPEVDKCRWKYSDGSYPAGDYCHCIDDKSGDNPTGEQILQDRNCAAAPEQEIPPKCGSFKIGETACVASECRVCSGYIANGQLRARFVDTGESCKPDDPPCSETEPQNGPVCGSSHEREFDYGTPAVISGFCDSDSTVITSTPVNFSDNDTATWRCRRNSLYVDCQASKKSEAPPEEPEEMDCWTITSEGGIAYCAKETFTTESCDSVGAYDTESLCKRNLNNPEIVSCGSAHQRAFNEADFGEWRNKLVLNNYQGLCSPRSSIDIGSIKVHGTSPVLRWVCEGSEGSRKSCGTVVETEPLQDLEDCECGGRAGTYQATDFAWDPFLRWCGDECYPRNFVPNHLFPRMGLTVRWECASESGENIRSC
jgi:hypothetical protein